MERETIKKDKTVIGITGGVGSGKSRILEILKNDYGADIILADDTAKELMERGVSLGADIPYCIMRGTALAEGIGERLRRLAPMPECFIVLAKPPVSVSTKFVYGNLKADEIKSHPDIEGMERALQTGSLEGIAACMGNVLETVTIAAYPVVGEIKERMREDGAAAALMSGSGPTVFGIFEEKEAADRCRMKLRTDGLVKQAYTVRPFNKRV